MTERETHADWVKRMNHSDPGMIFLRKTIARLVKDFNIVEIDVWEDGESQLKTGVSQKEINKACRECLEVSDDIGLNLTDASGYVYWVGVLWQGPYTIEDAEEIIFNYSTSLGEIYS